MLDNSIDKILQDGFPPELPYGFAERVAFNAIRMQSGTIWDFFLGLVPRVGMAVGAVAMVLLVLGFSGSGPNMVDTVSHYDAYSQFISIP